MSNSTAAHDQKPDMQKMHKARIKQGQGKGRSSVASPVNKDEQTELKKIELRNRKIESSLRDKGFASKEIVYMPLSDIKILEGFNPYKPLSPEKYEGLVQGIINIGLQYHILVNRVGDEYHIVDGEHRYRAFCELYEVAKKEGFEDAKLMFQSIPATIMEVSYEQAKIIARVTGYRRDHDEEDNREMVCDLAEYIVENNLTLRDKFLKASGALSEVSSPKSVQNHARYYRSLTPSNWKERRKGRLETKGAELLCKFPDEIQEFFHSDCLGLYSRKFFMRFNGNEPLEEVLKIALDYQTEKNEEKKSKAALKKYAKRIRPELMSVATPDQEKAIYELFDQLEVQLKEALGRYIPK